LTVLRAAEDFVEASERLAGRIEQGPIVQRDFDASAAVFKCGAAPSIEVHFVRSVPAWKRMTGITPLTQSLSPDPIRKVELEVGCR
jgi:hypothetical protein